MLFTTKKIQLYRQIEYLQIIKKLIQLTSVFIILYCIHVK